LKKIETLPILGNVDCLLDRGRETWEAAQSFVD